MQHFSAQSDIANPPRLRDMAGNGRFSNQSRPEFPEVSEDMHPRAIELGETLREIAANGAGATFKDLIAAGFTSPEIIEHEPDARRYAARKSERQITPPGDRVHDIIQKAIEAVANQPPLTAGAEMTLDHIDKWRRFCAARAAMKLDPWVSQSERCVHLLKQALTALPLLANEVNRICCALAAHQKAAMVRGSR